MGEWDIEAVETANRQIVVVVIIVKWLYVYRV